MANAAVSYKEKVMLLLIRCLVFGCGGSVFGCTLLCVLSGFAIILKRKRAGCLASIVLRMSCYCKCYVTLPHGAMG